jgi:hypothetical protein
MPQSFGGLTGGDIGGTGERLCCLAAIRTAWTTGGAAWKASHPHFYLALINQAFKRLAYPLQALLGWAARPWETRVRGSTAAWLHDMMQAPQLPNTSAAAWLHA